MQKKRDPANQPLHKPPTAWSIPKYSTLQNKIISH